MNVADCHLHILDPDRFAYDPRAPYLPAPHETAPADMLAAVHEAHGITHALLVGPTSGYGYDNRCLLDALAKGGGRWRGIALAPPDASMATLSSLAAAGVVGLRIDLAAHGPGLAEACLRAGLFDRMRELGWVLQVQTDARLLPAALPALKSARLTLVFDHCGRPAPPEGLGQAGFAALLALGREGAAHVKLSGANRWAGGHFPHVAAEPFVAAILDAFTPARCVWGSDWPFLRAPIRLDYGPELALLGRWIPDERARRRVLWDTPRSLFGFADDRAMSPAAVARPDQTNAPNA
ncbi:MAG: amidohydrolase family protein [Acetobacteraceae bacterium]|nr:amidohydrolase family protein [Acetobacteraceae bacterium]